MIKRLQHPPPLRGIWAQSPRAAVLKSAAQGPGAPETSAGGHCDLHDKTRMLVGPHPLPEAHWGVLKGYLTPEDFTSPASLCLHILGFKNLFKFLT